MNDDKVDRYAHDQKLLLDCIDEIKELDKEFLVLRTKCKHYISDPGNAMMGRVCGKKRTKTRQMLCMAETCPLT